MSALTACPSGRTSYLEQLIAYITVDISRIPSDNHKPRFTSLDPDGAVTSRLRVAGPTRVVPSQVRRGGQETGKVREDEEERYWAAAGEERLESFSRNEALRRDDAWG